MAKVQPSIAGFATESTDGRFISITATTSGGSQTLHDNTIQAGTQRIRLDAFNNSAVDVDLTLQWAGTSSTDEIVMTVPAKAGPVSVVPDWLLLKGKTLKAYAGTTAVISVYMEYLRHDR